MVWDVVKRIVCACVDMAQIFPDLSSTLERSQRGHRSGVHRHYIIGTVACSLVDALDLYRSWVQPSLGSSICIEVKRTVHIPIHSRVSSFALTS